MRRLVLATPVMILVVLTHSLGASAHPDDLIRAGKRAGPLVLGETTRAEAVEFFGEPDFSRKVSFGCIKARKLIWRGKLTSFFWRGDDHPVLQVHVKKREIDAGDLGSLKMHTWKGLHVGDSVAELQSLYPNANSYDHGGHTHWLLFEKEGQGRLIALSRGDYVRKITTEYYEYC